MRQILFNTMELIQKHMNKISKWGKQINSWSFPFPWDNVWNFLLRIITFVKADSKCPLMSEKIFCFQQLNGHLMMNDKTFFIIHQLNHIIKSNGKHHYQTPSTNYEVSAQVYSYNFLCCLRYQFCCLFLCAVCSTQLIVLLIWKHDY